MHIKIGLLHIKVGSHINYAFYVRCCTHTHLTLTELRSSSDSACVDIYNNEYNNEINRFYNIATEKFSYTN